MSGRERILTLLTLGVLVLGLSYVLFYKLLLAPAAELREQAQGVAVDVARVQGEVDLGPAYREQLLDAARRSFGADETAASQGMRAHLVRLHERCGLDATDLSLTPVTGSQLVGAREVGWVLRTRGSIDRLTDLLFLLQVDPHLHRIDGVSWSPVANSTKVDLQLRYATLVLDPVAGAESLAVEPDRPEGLGEIDSEARAQYDLIADRDVFRPYIKRPPPPAPPRRASRPAPARSTSPRPQEPAAPPWKLVSLSSFDGRPQVVLRELPDGPLKKLKVGDELAGGEIVMVDYRAMPHPTRPRLRSPSRVIVRDGEAHWAIELGQRVRDRRRMADDDLPAALHRETNVAPAVAPDTPAAAGSAAAAIAGGEPASAPGSAATPARAQADDADAQERQEISDVP